MASIEAASCEAPESDEPCGEDHANGAPATPASSQAPPKAKAKGRGRPVRPRIDLDEQIAHANKLAEVSKKMLVAAKSAQKAQKKQKQRLIRKAGKLSAEDLERMAVLKRCGLYAEDGEDVSAPENVAKKTVADQEEVPVAGPVEKRSKLSDKLAKISGTDMFVQSLSQPLASNAASGSSGSQASGSNGSQLLQPSSLPRGKRLVRAPSNAGLQRFPPPAAPAEWL